MHQVAVSDVSDDGATIPRDVLRVLRASPGDTVAFVQNDDGSLVLMKALPRPVRRRLISNFVGVFATGEQRTLEQELALLQEMRYGDDLDEQS